MSETYDFVGRTFVVKTRYWVNLLYTDKTIYREPGDIFVVIDALDNCYGTFYILCLHSDGLNKLFSSNCCQGTFDVWVEELEP